MAKLSKVAEAKQNQGFQVKPPTCSNCMHFSSDTKELQTSYGNWTKEHNLRCAKGNFKVGKSNWCTAHLRREVIEE